MDAFLGSVWFSIMVGLVGYIMGSVMPVSKIKEKLGG